MKNPEIHYKQAILITAFSALFYAIMSMFAKLAADKVPTDMIVFFRFLVSFSYILMVIAWRKKTNNPVNLRTKNFKLHLFRSLSGVLAMMLLYYALAYIPLYNVSLLGTTYPLFIPILATLFMGIITPKKVWLGIIVGFVGVIFILNPSKGIIQWPSLIALGGGFSIAISAILLRQAAKKEDIHTIMFYFFGLTFLYSIVMVAFHWQTPSKESLLMLLGVGVFGTLYQEFNVRALVHAPARIVSTIMYLNIIFSVLLSWLVFHQLPDIIDWLGFALVFAGAIYAIFHASRSDMLQKR